MTTQLTTVREINAAIRNNEQGRGSYVFATVFGITMNYEARIYQARSIKGVLQTRILSTGKWIAPLKVWQE